MKTYQTGRTKDAGFQFGIKRTFPLESDLAWERLFSETGRRIWLGDLVGGGTLTNDFET